MRTANWLGVCVALAAAGVLTASENDQKGKAAGLDSEKLVGTWTYVSGQKNGEKIDPDRFKGQTVAIAKEKFTLKGEATFVMSYKLDAKQSPARVSFTMTESPFGAGATAEGIIELSGDELKVCYADTGEAPKKFEAPAGSNHRLFVLKRSN